MSFAERTALEAHRDLHQYRVIDVREEHEFNGPLGFIEYAELIPLKTLERAAADIDGSATLLVVCRSGNRSGKACERLQALGFEDVTNLSGGMIGWNQAELPVHRTEPASLSALVEQIIRWAAQVGPWTIEEAQEWVRGRFERHDVSLEAPSPTAVDDLIGFLGESLAETPPADLDLSLQSFRRSLAKL